MLIKLLYLSIITFVLWMTTSNNVVFSTADIKPYRDSFDILKSQNMTFFDSLDTVYDAEQARVKHLTNLTAISRYMREKFERFGPYPNCFANTGAIIGEFYATPQFIYLKSDTTDNMHIVCYKTCTVNCNGTLITL